MIDKKVYLFKCEFLDGTISYKIGVSKNTNIRSRNLNTGNPLKITIVDEFISKFPFKVERALHRRFNSKKMEGEWFNLNDKEALDFKNICDLIENNLDFLEKSQNPYI